MNLCKSSIFHVEKVLCRRQIHCGIPVYGRARTYESKAIPGSDEHVNPTAWAKRLFRLNEIRQNTPKTPQTSQNAPPLLHMVCRVKPVKSVPHYQRAVLERYGLGKDVKVSLFVLRLSNILTPLLLQNHQWVLVKNSPAVNENLDTVKHLIRIQPVEFPQGIPKETDDLTKCRLLPDGRFLRWPKNAVVGELVTSHDESSASQLSISRPDEASCERLFAHSGAGPQGYLTRSYLREYHNRRWSQFELFSEFFPSSYRYKLNQDGSEYRYSRLWRLDNAMFNAVRAQRNTDGTRTTPNQSRFDANWSTFPWSRF